MSDPVLGIQTLFPGSVGYKQRNPQYATSTYGTERQMDPGTIVLPSSVGDISTFVNSMYNATVLPGVKRKALAIRSGGHQYSGASSTDSNNVVLDLGDVFKSEPIELTFSGGKAYIRASCSQSLNDLFTFMKSKGVFCPTGQCITVHVGGHCQTGGYGMFGRSLGLLGDKIRELEVIDTKGVQQVISKTTNPELFYGLLGGSPGNLGVVTHAKWEVEQDINHKGSRALWAVFPFDKSTYKYLLDLLVKCGEDPNFPRNYDMTVNVHSEGIDLNHLFPGSKDELRNNAPNKFFGKDGVDPIDQISTVLRIPAIVVYAQWVNFGNDVFTPDLWQSIKQASGIRFYKESKGELPMSELASWWLFTEPREYPYPYVKRTCASNSTTISKSGWTAWFSDHVSSIVSILNNGLWYNSQIQFYGGKFSQFPNNANNGTAFSWRDTTIGGTWDVFYEPGKKAAAEKWQAETDAGNFGPNGKFCKTERRLLWGSYGDWDMSKVWPFYYDKETYDKLRIIRGKADPKGIFTPNPFCVPALGTVTDGK
jgi:hypothetical protein